MSTLQGCSERHNVHKAYGTTEPDTQQAVKCLPSLLPYDDCYYLYFRYYGRLFQIHRGMSAPRPAWLPSDKTEEVHTPDAWQGEHPYPHFCPISSKALLQETVFGGLPATSDLPIMLPDALKSRVWQGAGYTFTEPHCTPAPISLFPG